MKHNSACGWLTTSAARESIAIEEPGAFFPLLDAVTNPETFSVSSDGLSPRGAHQHAFDMALSLNFLAQPGAYVAAEMHVALHSASPKLEVFYQYDNDHHATRRDDPEVCGSWVDWRGGMRRKDPCTAC